MDNSDCAIKGCDKVAIYTKDGEGYCANHYSAAINGKVAKTK